MLTLDRLDRAEALRYLGDANVPVNDAITQLLDECEPLVLQNAEPKFLYREKDLPWPELQEGQGEDIQKHLANCEKAVLFCITLGNKIDKLLRVMQVQDMAKAVLVDTLASVAIEQAAAKFDEYLKGLYPDWYQTFRFSPGYGDFPITLQPYILQQLDAPRKIGLTVNDSMLLVPTKSETAVIGLSKEPLPKRARGCATCTLNQTCRFRKTGSHC